MVYQAQTKLANHALGKGDFGLIHAAIELSETPENLQQRAGKRELGRASTGKGGAWVFAIQTLQ
jgi:hypothetical protein